MKESTSKGRVRDHLLPWHKNLYGLCS